MASNLSKMKEQLEQKKKERTAVSVSDILPGDNNEPVIEAPKVSKKQEPVASPTQYNFKYPWLAFDPNDKGKKAGQQSVSVDVNDYELAVLNYLMEIRDTSTRKEARRLLRPAIKKIAKMIEDQGPEDFQF